MNHSEHVICTRNTVKVTRKRGREWERPQRSGYVPNRCNASTDRELNVAAVRSNCTGTRTCEHRLSSRDSYSLGYAAAFISVCLPSVRRFFLRIQPKNIV